METLACRPQRNLTQLPALRYLNHYTSCFRARIACCCGYSTARGTLSPASPPPNHGERTNWPLLPITAVTIVYWLRCISTRRTRRRGLDAPTHRVNVGSNFVLCGASIRDTTQKQSTVAECTVHDGRALSWQNSAPSSSARGDRLHVQRMNKNNRVYRAKRSHYVCVRAARKLMCCRTKRTFV